MMASGMLPPVETENPIIQNAFYLSYALYAEDVDCSNKRQNYTDDEAFKQYVLRTIEDFNKSNPGVWIILNLSLNNLNGEALQNLVVAIVKKVQELHIDIANLKLSSNSLTTLPENVFVGLDNLQELDLMCNDISTLPENVFLTLYNLQILWLTVNKIRSLPENVFLGLRNLQRLYLAGNELKTLPENIFLGLFNLLSLDLSGNMLIQKSNEELHIGKNVIVYW